MFTQLEYYLLNLLQWSLERIVTKKKIKNGTQKKNKEDHMMMTGI